MPGDQIQHKAQQPTGKVTGSVPKHFSRNWEKKKIHDPGTLQNLMLSSDTCTTFLLHPAKRILQSD